MRRLLLALAAILATAISACNPPRVAQGAPVLTPDARAQLRALKAKAKFRPDYLAGYVGVDAPEDLPPLTASVNGLIDDVLAHPDGPVSEGDILPLVATAVHKVDAFATADRERAYRYFGQVWTILGLQGEPVRQVP